MSKISIRQKFSLFTEEWAPKIIAESNGQLVKIAKGSGERVWHSHEHEDELFIVFKGHLTLQLRDKNIELDVGDMYVVPKGIEHCPLAEDDTHFMMIEPFSTQHTGPEDLVVTVPKGQQEWI
ncbi:cupin domain-containing protein [Marinomonas sp.]|nr:cupin domain-containing protein [Marinomonas sp.]MDB4837988.1 cupin domain-containing protein [Marinomonas sp.]